MNAVDQYILLFLRKMKGSLESIRQGNHNEIMIFRMYYRILPPNVVRRLSEIDRHELLFLPDGYSEFDMSPKLLSNLKRDAIIEQIDRAIFYYESEGDETYAPEKETYDAARKGFEG